MMETIVAIDASEIGPIMKCQAVRDGGDWIVSGSKHFISGAEHADFFIVFVATGVDDTPKGPKKRITCFLVDRGTPGFEVREGYNSVSHKGYKNYILYFDGCRLPDSQVLGEVDGGFAVMPGCRLRKGRSASLGKGADHPGRTKFIQPYTADVVVKMTSGPRPQTRLHRCPRGRQTVHNFRSSELT